jgi:hypothetical protein
MQRLILLSTILATAALTASANAAASDLRIATFQADVTPPVGAILCHGNVDPAKEIVDPLTARGIVLWSGEKPIVLCAIDWVAIANASHDAWRAALAEAVGTTPDRVAVHTVHQHDTPGVDESTEAVLAQHGLAGAMFDVEPAKAAIRRVADAARKAAEHPQRVTHLGMGKGKVAQVASNRCILGPDSKCVATRMSSCRDAAVRAQPEGIIDPYVRLLTFWDGDQPLACLTYYATHPQSYYGKGGVSWDFVGMARAEREKAVPGAVHLHFNGAGGNIAAGKYNDGSPENRPLLAGRLAAGMKAAWADTRKVPVAAEDVRWHVLPVVLPVRDTIDEAALTQTLSDASVSRRDRVFAARELAWLKRVQSGHEIDLAALRIGPAVVLHMPAELCIGYQLAAQAMAPERFVCMAAYGNNGPGYIPLKIAYTQGGYETTRVSRVAPDVEDVLMTAMHSLLEQAK